MSHRQYNMAHALCALNNLGYRHTLRICNIYCFSTARIVARMRLNVTFICTELVFLILKRSENSTFYFVLYASGVLQLKAFI